MSKKTSAIFAAALCVIAVGALWYVSKSDPLLNESSVLDAKEFQLKDIKETTHRLSDYRNQIVILHFWASWCPPCMDELPDILDFARQFEEKSVRLILVSLDRSWKEAESVLSTLSLPKNAISLLDIDAQVPTAYGSFQYPETYIIGRDSKILMKWVGPQKWEDPRYKDFINKI